MDDVMFRSLTARVVATRNAESRAFLKAFDRVPGRLTGWREPAAARWRVWTDANEALRGAVGQLEAFLGADSPAAR